MMSTYYLAIDIGASSGRHILGSLEDDQLKLTEVYRFSNSMVTRYGQLCWDSDALFDEVLRGMKRCAEQCKIPVSVGIDTWGVDFALLDGAGERLGNTVAYRDSRTAGMDSAVFDRIPERELYARTGIQTEPFNTIFQLMALKKQSPALLARAKTLLLTPDYLNYRLSGLMRTEYSIASTTGLLNAESRSWDGDVLQICGFPCDIFTEIAPPGTVLGGLRPEIRARVGYGARVILPCCHDTASAVTALPSTEEDTLYISSGTWSLLGVERPKPDCSPESMAGGFSNEGGYGGGCLCLRNIMGLWMIQSVKRELADRYSFDELCALAERTEITSLVNCNDNRFLAPDSMVREIQNACAQSGQRAPSTPGELTAVIYHSLAACYRDSVNTIERLTGTAYPAIHIIGGGSRDALLNALTASATGKPVRAGPSEATAIGNLLVQMIADGVFEDLKAARACVIRSGL